MGLAKVDFFDLRYDHRHRSPVLFLKDADKDKFLPVWIGELEASSIEHAVFGKSAPRPLTHDLFSNVLENLNARVGKVVIDRLESRTYYATLFIESEGRIYTVDSRPSDAVAIALREDSEIFVDERLMLSIKFVEPDETDIVEEMGDSEIEQALEIDPDDDTFKDFLNRISPTDFKDG